MICFGGYLHLQNSLPNKSTKAKINMDILLKNGGRAIQNPHNKRLGYIILREKLPILFICCMFILLQIAKISIYFPKMEKATLYLQILINLYLKVKE
jgi:hypothetical protein